MNIRSLRFRLITLYFFTFFLSVIFIFLVFYTLTKEIIYQQTDKEIISHGDKISEVISAKSTGIHSAFSKDELDREFSEMPGMLVVVADKTGKVITSSQRLYPNALILSDIIQKSANIIRPVFLNRTLGTAEMRLGIFPLSSNNNIADLVIVGHPINIIQNTLNDLVITLSWTILIIGLLSVVGGYFIAKRALKPIKEFSERLTMISSTNLHQQIENPQTQDELEDLSLSFNTLLKRLDNSFNRERQFIGDIAHELKTPLAIMKNTIEVALTKNRSSKDYHDTIASSLIDVNSMSSIINEILDLAWSKSDNSELLKDRIDMTKLVFEIEDLLRKTAKKRHIQISAKIKENIFINGDRQKLFRAIVNLIDNAVKYTPENGKITLNLDSENQELFLEITNTGKGIKSEDLPFVFERFYRGGSHNKTLGSGLGLAICKSIIEAHSGKIIISSIPDKLTIAKITLPSS